MGTVRSARARRNRQDSPNRVAWGLAQDAILYDAALRNLQTLAEATQQLPDRQKACCPDIPWRQISGFRNILVHNYLGDIDPLTIAAVIDTHLPALEDCVRTMLQEADPRSSG